MLAQQRQELILEEIRRAGSVRVSELTARLGVSDMTVRRDLDRLEADGALQKVHGGAIVDARQRVAEEPSFASKRMIAQPAKQAIAARAAALVEPGTAIAISAGTTTWAMAAHLATVPALTVVTNSITVAETIIELGDPTMQTVILTGGIRTPSAALVGPVADLTIRSLHFDHLFIGTYGFDVRAGFTSPNLAESETNRALIGQARHVVVLSDSSKWKTVGLASWGAISQADVLICDDGLDPAAVAALDGVGPELVLVAPLNE
ncbi:DeoR/GlpR family DNA-binding transcription regulator [Nocardioides rubriscoriae]|uniref:DeoR/GlpR family DNA-binding transcription regulator n=1 Tax=Nocardioides rubriscoriae TaxID=642762 RepID=UPI0011DF6068|nr:DeoR/GlpR family DNA-binding transcription regulator [Nocardioides rubriscoriae]